jgi:hypothetical protein
MNAIFWLGIVGLLAFIYFGIMLIAELKAQTAILAHDKPEFLYHDE